MNVKCINNTGVEKVLTNGQVYEVIKWNNSGPFGGTYYLKGLELHGMFLANRFTITHYTGWDGVKINFDEAAAPTQRAPQPTKPTTDSNYDAEEERMRALLKPRRNPGECSCGIQAVDCDYHRPPKTPEFKFRR